MEKIFFFFRFGDEASGICRCRQEYTGPNMPMFQAPRNRGPLVVTCALESCVTLIPFIPTGILYCLSFIKSIYTVISFTVALINVQPLEPNHHNNHLKTSEHSMVLS